MSELITDAVQNGKRFDKLFFPEEKTSNSKIIQILLLFLYD
jgi:hypothetical protein